jgi:small nuclear ribonucleoprotein D1
VKRTTTAARFTHRERPTNTNMKLVHFLMKLQNEVVQVELKNGTQVQGTLLSVSPAMNMNLRDAKMTVPHRDTIALEHITLRGNQVRMVLLPDELNLDSVLQETVAKSEKDKEKEKDRGREMMRDDAGRAPKRVTRTQNRGF